MKYLWYFTLNRLLLLLAEIVVLIETSVVICTLGFWIPRWVMPILWWRCNRKSYKYVQDHSKEK